MALWYKGIVVISIFFIVTMSLAVSSASGIDWRSGFVEVEGYGAPGSQAQSPAQAHLLAQRGAKADAYRNLLELVSGVRIDAQTTVRDLMTSDAVHTQVAGFVKGAVIVKNDTLYDGSCRVVMRAPLYGVQGLQAIVQISPNTEALNPATAKVILDQRGDSAGLTVGDVHANLNWYRGMKNKINDAQKVDLDLGCFYENGAKQEVLDALNKRFGNFSAAPFISIDVDDRSGRVESGENLLVNGQQMYQFKRILLYAYIYQGLNRWSEMDGIVTISQKDKPDIVIRLDKPDARQRMCAIASIETDGSGQYKLTRLGEYFNSHEDMSQAYQWGFHWKQGNK